MCTPGRVPAIYCVYMTGINVLPYRSKCVVYPAMCGIPGIVYYSIVWYARHKCVTSVACKVLYTRQCVLYPA